MLTHIQSFFDSNSFTGFATILTGLIAVLVYYLQKATDKNRAARVLLTEIRLAEERLAHIREKITNGMATDLPPIFPTKNWQNYSHLFISDFDQDELRLINKFYDYGELIEEFARRNNDYFWISTEERARVTVQKLADFASDALTLTAPGETVESYVMERRNSLNHLLDEYNSVYTPKKTLEGIRDMITNIPTITTSSAGIKLKKLGSIRL